MYRIASTIRILLGAVGFTFATAGSICVALAPRVEFLKRVTEDNPKLAAISLPIFTAIAAVALGVMAPARRPRIPWKSVAQLQTEILCWDLAFCATPTKSRSKWGRRTKQNAVAAAHNIIEAGEVPILLSQEALNSAAPRNIVDVAVANSAYPPAGPRSIPPYPIHLLVHCANQSSERQAQLVLRGWSGQGPLRHFATWTDTRNSPEAIAWDDHTALRRWTRYPGKSLMALVSGRRAIVLAILVVGLTNIATRILKDSAESATLWEGASLALAGLAGAYILLWLGACGALVRRSAGHSTEAVVAVGAATSFLYMQHSITQALVAATISIAFLRLRRMSWSFNTKNPRVLRLTLGPVVWLLTTLDIGASLFLLALIVLGTSTRSKAMLGLIWAGYNLQWPLVNIIAIDSASLSIYEPLGASSSISRACMAGTVYFMTTWWSRKRNYLLWCFCWQAIQFIGLGIQGPNGSSNEIAGVVALYVGAASVLLLIRNRPTNRFFATASSLLLTTTLGSFVLGAPHGLSFMQDAVKISIWCASFFALLVWRDPMNIRASLSGISYGVALLSFVYIAPRWVDCRLRVAFDGSICYPESDYYSDFAYRACFWLLCTSLMAVLVWLVLRLHYLNFRRTGPWSVWDPVVPTAVWSMWTGINRVSTTSWGQMSEGLLFTLLSAISATAFVAYFWRLVTTRYKGVVDAGLILLAWLWTSLTERSVPLILIAVGIFLLIVGGPSTVFCREVVRPRLKDYVWGICGVFVIALFVLFGDRPVGALERLLVAIMALPIGVCITFIQGAEYEGLPLSILVSRGRWLSRQAPRFLWFGSCASLFLASLASLFYIRDIAFSPLPPSILEDLTWLQGLVVWQGILVALLAVLAVLATLMGLLVVATRIWLWSGLQLTLALEESQRGSIHGRRPIGTSRS